MICDNCLHFPICHFDDAPDECPCFLSNDLVEVVRCKECEYYRSYYDMFKAYYDSPITEDEMHSGQCNYIGKRTGVYMEVNENDYCCWGERKETNE